MTINMTESGADLRVHAIKRMAENLDKEEVAKYKVALDSGQYGELFEDLRQRGFRDEAILDFKNAAWTQGKSLQIAQPSMADSDIVYKPLFDALRFALKNDKDFLAAYISYEYRTHPDGERFLRTQDITDPEIDIPIQDSDAVMIDKDGEIVSIPNARIIRQGSERKLQRPDSYIYLTGGRTGETQEYNHGQIPLLLS